MSGELIGTVKTYTKNVEEIIRANKKEVGNSQIEPLEETLQSFHTLFSSPEGRYPLHLAANRQDLILEGDPIIPMWNKFVGFFQWYIVEGNDYSTEGDEGLMSLPKPVNCPRHLKILKTSLGDQELRVMEIPSNIPKEERKSIEQNLIKYGLDKYFKGMKENILEKKVKLIIWKLRKFGGNIGEIFIPNES